MNKKPRTKKPSKKKQAEAHDPHTHAPAHVPSPAESHIPELAKMQKKSLDQRFAAACAKLPPIRRQFGTDEQREAYILFVKENS
jgi:hypothetical protein